MNIHKQYQDDHQMLLTVQVEPETVESARQRAARKLSKQTKIPGFRPGKAPMNVVLRTIGEAAVFEEAVEILANELYPKIIDEAEINPYGPGQLEKIAELEPLTLEFLVPLEAEVTLEEYHHIRFPYEPPIIVDEDIERVLVDLRNRQAIIESVDRPIEETDEVGIQLSAKRNLAKEGENPTLFELHPTTILIKDNNEEAKEEWPFPGFSRNLIGMTVNEEKTITYHYPEESEWESLRGQEADFYIQIQSIKSRKLPALDDDFAQTVGKYDSMDALISDIRSSLENQSLHDYQDNYHQKIINDMVQSATIKYPPQMIDHEIHLYIDQFENQLAQQGLDLETYLKTRQMDEQSLHEEVKPLAETRLKHTLVLFQVAKQENIRVTNDEVEAESSQVLAQISKYMTPDQARKAITEGYIRTMVGNISTDILVRRTYNVLESIAKGEYKPETAESEISPDNSVEESESLTTSEKDIASVDIENSSE